MKIELLEVWREDEDLSVLVRYRLPKVEYESFINIDELFEENEDFDDSIFDSDWLENNGDAIRKYISSRIKYICRGHLKHETPLWSELDSSVTDLIYSHISEMGFISYEDCDGKCEEVAKPFIEALKKFPNLHEVIEIGMTFPVCNDDVITTYGDCACYVNWFGYKG